MRNSTQYSNVPKTFRRSSRKLLPEKNKKNIGWGNNLQNIEKDLRAIYIPDGYNDNLKARCAYWLKTGDTSIFTEEELSTLRVLLQRDQSGAEALIVAYDSEPGDYRQLFIHNVKPHVYVALKLFVETWKKKIKEHNVRMDEDDVDILSITPIAKLKLNPLWRDLDLLIRASDNWSLTERYYYYAKQTVHSGNYDIQWAKFIFNVLEKSGGKIVIPKEEGRRFLETYRGLFPEIPERNERIKRQVQQTKILYNLLGFPYTITNENITETTYKEYYAWGPQSTVGEITRIAFTKTQSFIEEQGKRWDLLADTHDSFLIQCPLLDIKECYEITEKFMNIEMASPIDGVKFSMKSEANVGFCWAPYKPEQPEKHILGLRELEWLK